MKIYCAPMEGITGYVYRNAHHAVYKGVDQYFTPFLTPKRKRGYTSRERNDVLPEHNQGVSLVPQILTNRADDFVSLGKRLQAMGYQEINLNLGCPSGTVVAKGKGSGFLEDPEELLHFFDQVFHQFDGQISIKTRLGLHDEQEALELMKVYNQFPFCKVIIHARVKDDMYRLPARKEMFGQCLAMSTNPVCYNGDIMTVEDLQQFREQFPEVESVMLGRGLIQNPQFPEMIREGGDFDLARFQHFLDLLVNGYEEIMSGERDVLFKMKELWTYMIKQFPGQEKILKKIRKSKTVVEYKNHVKELLS